MPSLWGAIEELPIEIGHGSLTPASELNIPIKFIQPEEGTNGVTSKHM